MRLKVILTSLVLFLLALVAIAFTVVMATDFNRLPRPTSRSG